MDFLVGWQKFETAFNGAEVVMELRSLKRDAYLVLMSNISVFQEMGEDGKEVSTEQASQMMDLINAFVDFFPKYVRNIDGFTVSGQAPTPELLIEEAAFSPLVMTIIAQLSVITTLQRVDEKN